MDPIKPIESILDDIQRQSFGLAEVVQDRYWQQQAQEVPPVETSEDTSEIVANRHGQAEEKKAPRRLRRTYAEFEVNQETRTVTVRIIDAESGKLIRTVPPEELAREIARGKLAPSQLRQRATLV